MELDSVGIVETWQLLRKAEGLGPLRWMNNSMQEMKLMKWHITLLSLGGGILFVVNIRLR